MIHRLNRILTTSLARAARFLKDESGPTAVEYALMIALILTALILGVNTLTSQATQVFEQVGEEVANSTNGN